MRAPIFLLVVLIYCWLLPVVADARPPETDRKFTVSGHVKDAASGELLPGATVFSVEAGAGVITNAYGYYSISLPPGSYQMRYSFVGYKTLLKTVDLEKDIVMEIALEAGTDLDEVEITGKRPDENIRASEMSLVRLDVKTINRIPAMLGEVDILKAIQLLPGVQATSEGSTGFSVRGGNSDQNLIILDEATVYNAAHLMGFFSVFNNDAVKEVTLYKGDMPAAYGGRLSSLLDVRMRDGNEKLFKVTGGVGTVSSRLTLEGPVVKDRASFLLSGRRTYADLFLPFAKNEDVRDNKLYFYDFNGKFSATLNPSNRIYFSGYAGRDIFKNRFARMGFGNRTASFRWNHLFTSRLFLNTSAVFSTFDYNLGAPTGDANAFNWDSGMKDFSLRLDFTHYVHPDVTLRYGGSSTLHQFFPGTATGLGDESFITEFKLPESYALEHALFASNEHKVSSRLTLKYGLRFSALQNIGPGTFYRFDSLYLPLDSVVYKRGELVNTDMGFEPRISFAFILDEQSSVKGHYSHTYQYLALAQNSTAGTPLDIWFPSSPNIRPQVADQLALGYFRNFHHNAVETSVEVYYKKIRRVIDFRDHAVLLLNPYIEGEVRTGEGTAWGIEFLARKNEGAFTGWVSYTYARSWRKIAEINDGKRYPAPYDKPHTLNVVITWQIVKRLEASATWVYATGVPVTFPTGRAVIGNVILPIYSDRNAYRMPDYHRLDLSLTLKGKDKPKKKWHGEWNLSVYNAYNRKNAWSINFETDPSDPYLTYAVKTYLFSVIPALTYNFRIP